MKQSFQHHILPWPSANKSSSNTVLHFAVVSFYDTSFKTWMLQIKITILKYFALCVMNLFLIYLVSHSELSVNNYYICNYTIILILKYTYTEMYLYWVSTSSMSILFAAFPELPSTPFVLPGWMFLLPDLWAGCWCLDRFVPWDYLKDQQ